MLLRKKSPRRWMGPALGTAGVLLTLASAFALDRAARAAVEGAPNPGAVVVLENVQKITERILRDALDAEEASEGFAIVTEPATGRVLAVANVDTTGKKQGYWALSQRMEPASLAKTLVAAEALDRKVTTPQEKHFCENGKYHYAGRDFHDWREKGFQHLTTAQTIAKSSDICTVKIAEKIGLEGVHELLEKFGFGPGGTASAFAGAATGQLPPRGGKLDRFLVPYVAYGQGFRSTPLELMQAYAAIANGGELLQPLPATATPSDRKVIRQVLRPDTARQMREILEGVVHEGTARLRARSYLYSTAGKTASAFSPDDSWLETSRGTRKSNLAGFLGFAPAQQPKVEVLVVIRSPKVSIDRDSGAHGAEHAAPVFRQIAEAVLQELKVAPDAL